MLFRSEPGLFAGDMMGNLTGENGYGRLEGRRRCEERAFWRERDLCLRCRRISFLNTHINVRMKRGEESAIRRE